jgi:hypothetical protein
MAKKQKKSVTVRPKLTEPELDLLAKMERGYQLETDLLSSNAVLRRLKDNEVIRPVSVNRNTITAMQERGLIKPAKGKDALTIVWRPQNKAK